MKRVLLFCAMSLPALACAAPGDEWYINPQIGGISPDHQRDLQKHDWLYGIGFGRELGQYLNLELNFNGARINDGRAFRHLDTYGTSLDLLGVYNRTGLLAPYLSVGAGTETNNFVPGFTGRNRTDFMTEAGAGMFINLWRSSSGTSGFALRPDIKARWD